RITLKMALQDLSPRQRTCLVLTDYLGLDVGTVARLVKVRPSTVSVHLSRARKRIRERSNLGNDPFGEGSEAGYEREGGSGCPGAPVESCGWPYTGRGLCSLAGEGGRGRETTASRHHPHGSWRRLRLHLLCRRPRGRISMGTCFARSAGPVGRQRGGCGEPTGDRRYVGRHARVGVIGWGNDPQSDRLGRNDQPHAPGGSFARQSDRSVPAGSSWRRSELRRSRTRDHLPRRNQDGRAGSFRHCQLLLGTRRQDVRVRSMLLADRLPGGALILDEYERDFARCERGSWGHVVSGRHVGRLRGSRGLSQCCRCRIRLESSVGFGRGGHPVFASTEQSPARLSSSALPSVVSERVVHRGHGGARLRLRAGRERAGWERRGRGGDHRVRTTQRGLASWYRRALLRDGACRGRAPARRSIDALVAAWSRLDLHPGIGTSGRADPWSLLIPGWQRHLVPDAQLGTLAAELGCRAAIALVECRRRGESDSCRAGRHAIASLRLAMIRHSFRPALTRILRCRPPETRDPLSLVSPETR